jgi:hypothetical protein
MHSQYLMRASVLDRRPAKSGAVVARSGDTGKETRSRIILRSNSANTPIT